MRKKLKRRDYRSYSWTKGELALAAIQSAAVVGFLAYFFYRSIWACIPLCPVGVIYFKLLAAGKREKSVEQLNAQFKECILSVAASLKAGYAAENAFLESRADMVMLYGENAFICQELEVIRKGLIINITLEEQLNDLAVRSGSEDIYLFTQVFVIAKRSGGNLPEIISGSADMIGRKIEAGQELRTLLSGRRMEQSIMKIMPFGILTYVSIGHPGYFDGLYHNLQGIILMSVCLLIYLGAYCLSEKIMSDITREVTACT